MGTQYQSIVTVHVDVDAGVDRDHVLRSLEEELGAGHFLFRAERAAGDFTVSHEVVADDASLAQRQAEHLVAEALIRAKVESGTSVVGAEIRSSS